MAHSVRGKQRWLAALASLVLLVTGGARYAHAQTVAAVEQAPIKIAYSTSDFSVSPNEETASDYVHAYLQRVALYTDWSYQYLYVSKAEAERLLREGEIDFLCATEPSAQEEPLLRSELPLAQRGIVLYTMPQIDLYYEDYASLNKKKIGYVKDSFSKELLEKLETQQGFVGVHKEYQTADTMEKALEAGKIDAAISEKRQEHAERKVIALMQAPSAYLYALPENEKMQQLNTAMLRIEQEDPFYREALYSTYWRKNLGRFPLFTRAEAEYIRTAPEITVKLSGKRGPFFVEDDKTGKMEGIVPRILQTMTDLSGLQFRAEIADESGQSQATVIEVESLPMRTRAEGNSLGFFTGDIEFVKRDETALDWNSTVRLVLPSSMKAFAEPLLSAYPTLSITAADDLEQCLNKLLSGQADITLESSYYVSSLLQNNKYSGLRTFEGKITQERVSFNVASTDEMLRSVLSKTLAAMERTETEKQILHDAAMMNEKITMSDVLDVNQTFVILCGVLAVVLFATLVFTRAKHARLLKEQNRSLERCYQEELAYRKALLQNDQMLASLKMNLITGKVEDTQADYCFSGVVDCDELVNRIVETIPSERDKQAFRALFGLEQMRKNFVAGKADAQLAYRRRLKTGELHWVESIARILKRPGSEEITVFFYTRTIQNEMLMKKLISTLILNDYEALFYIDVQQDVAQLFPRKNDKNNMEQISGFEKRLLEWVYEHKDKTAPGDIVHQLAMSKVLHHLEQASVFQYVVPLIGKQRKLTQMRLRFSYIDRENQLLCLACDDVTHLYEREQQQTQRLREALSMAEMHAQSKSEFLSRMSHEMRTPMNAIIGLTDLAKKEAESSPAVQIYLNKISGAAGYLLNLINDILDMARIEHGKLQVRQEAFRFDQMLLPVLEMMETQAIKKKVYLKIESTLDEEWFYGDKMRIQQMLINLMGNAIKFTPSGGQVRLDVARIASEKGSHQVSFLISDTGIGMSKEFLNIMFEPFSQENVGATSQYRGTGLGLPISKNIIELMGGTIEAESEKDKGTLFTVTLPLSPASEPQTVETAKQIDYAVALKGRKVLLAEDHPLNIEITSKLLTSQGVAVTVARDGQQAMELFAASAPGWYDAVLMDIRMPVLDGYAATAGLRRMERADAKKVPIIAMTANAFQEDVEQALAAGMNLHLSKPVIPDLLYRTLENQIHRYRTEQP